MQLSALQTLSGDWMAVTSTAMTYFAGAFFRINPARGHD
jgi:hypothetical protein